MVTLRTMSKDRHDHWASNIWKVYYEELLQAGFGRLALQAIELFVKEHQGNKLNLSVFGFNKIAQNLYLSEGFEVTRIQMHKNLH